jgi:hypothetical protein
MNLFRNREPRLISLIAWTAIVCAPACGSSTGASKHDAGAEAGPDVSIAQDSVVSCPATCDDNNPCTDDSCDTTTFQCVHIPKDDNTPCQGKLCATKSVCQGGLCLDGPLKICPKPSDPCLIAGVCIDATGECSTPPAPDGKACDDGQKCTYAKQCLSGKCTGTPILCTGGKSCDPATGSCPTGGFPASVAGWTFDNVGWPSNGSGLVESADGQLFLAGRYAIQLDLGLGPITPPTTAPGGYGAPGDFDIFLAQLDPTTLKAAWVTTFPGPQAQNLAAFAVDGATPKHIAVVGPLQGAFTVAGKKLTATDPGDQFILGASATNGAGLWARRINLQNQTQLTGRTTGLTAIAGNPLSSTFLICGNVDCGSAPMLGDAGPDLHSATDISPSLGCQGGSDAVFALIDASEPDGGGGGGNGATLWADQVGGPNDEYCTTVASDNSGNAYVIGTYRFGSELKFELNSGQTSSLPVNDQAIGNPTWIYLAKLDLQQAALTAQDPKAKPPWLWATSIGTGTQALTPITMIAVDGDVVVAGKLTSGPQSVLGATLTSPYFIARFAGDSGKPLWVQEIGPGCGVMVSSLAAASGGVLVVSGTYSQACSFGAVPFASPDSTGGNAFLAQIEASSGKNIFAQGFANPGHPSKVLGTVGLPSASPIDPNGSLSLFTYSSEINLGSAVGVLSSTSVSASCLAALAP